MNSYLLLPLIFLKFWFVEAPLGILAFFTALNKAFFELFSLPLFVRTYFQPLKNEYREGLVGFSRVVGIFVKTIFIIFDLFLFSLLLAVEGAILFGFITFPITTILIWIKM